MDAGCRARERRALLDAIEEGAERALDLARWMHGHPELSLEETGTSARYRALLEADGFHVDWPVAGLETAFVADRGAETAPLRVALLAEMDALPEIGHACGHSLSGPASLLAASALRRVLEPADLALRVVGCPAEETGVGKRVLAEAGVFDSCAAALMAHASDMRRAHRLFLGTRKFEFIFHGRAAHAAAYPERGVNALDGVIATFVAIGLLRQQLPREVRVHGIVSEGGAAPNVIPERAAARFWVRALEAAELDAATQRVMQCARGAASATGTRLEVQEDPNASPPLRANLPLAAVYRAQLESLGLAETPHPPAARIGSSDITHVSQVTPTIHPNFPIGAGLQLHTRAFAAAAGSARGEAGMLEAARALALTCLALARDPEARRAVAEAIR
ncbi:MAG: amidohydrolase [Deltaproteobacteria bacterium]|nr:amidohydrolase [Deltaproteobacteria bacterium]MBW2362946.1 amidohydrolase [Deltaproteobacteria bacterium]